MFGLKYEPISKWGKVGWKWRAQTVLRILLRQNFTNPTKYVQGSESRYSKSGVKPCLTYIAQRVPEDLERRVTFTFDSEERRKLGDNNLDRRPCDESADRRSRDELNQPAESERSEEKNHDALKKRNPLSDQDVKLLCDLRIRIQEWKRFGG